MQLIAMVNKTYHVPNAIDRPRRREARTKPCLASVVGTAGASSFQVRNCLNWLRTLLALAALCYCAVESRGHGSPLLINGAGGMLAISGGLPLGEGYAAMAFDASDEAGLNFETAATIYNDLPGFDVTNLTSSSLQLEVLSRPDLTRAGAPPRWLWYWNPATGAVAEAADDPDFFILRKDLQGSLSFDQFTGGASSVLTLVDDAASEPHGHYVRYALDNVPAAAFGVYGFFARLLAPGSQPSQPVLLAFGYGADGDQYAAGASAINLAAGTAADFTADGRVDGSDLLAWQRTLGAAGSYPAADGSLNGAVDAADLALWRQAYGDSVASQPRIVDVPEPSTAVLGFVSAIWFWLKPRRGRYGPL